MDLIRALFLTLLIVAPSVALAETMSFEEAAAILGTSCGKDIDAYCRGVNLGSDRLKACLLRNQDSVSPQCKADYVRVFIAVKQRAEARASIAKICERDMLKLCPGVQKGDGNLLDCMLTAKRAVSAKCNQAITDAGYR